MAHGLKAGDVVHLSLGGCGACVPNCPDLTVEQVSDSGLECVCCWFGTDGSFHRHTFQACCLVCPTGNGADAAADSPPAVDTTQSQAPATTPGVTGRYGKVK